jgi:hypothetical protein
MSQERALQALFEMILLHDVGAYMMSYQDLSGGLLRPCPRQNRTESGRSKKLKEGKGKERKEMKDFSKTYHVPVPETVSIEVTVT